MSTWLLDSRTVRCSCCGLQPHTQNQVPHGIAMSIYQRAEAATNTFCSLCRFRVDSETCQRKCRCWHIVFYSRFPRAYPMQFCVQDSKQCRSRFFTTTCLVYEVNTLLICLRANYNWKQSSYLTNTLLLLNQCCLLLQNHNRLPMLPSVIMHKTACR